MAICPVCEHAQDEGGECALCGKNLGAPEEGAPAARMPDLEPTRLEAATPARRETMTDLEPTLHEPAPAAVAAEEGPAPWLERTALPPVSAPPDLLAVAACRYCRTPASPGDVFCARCGLKLAVYSRPSAEPRQGDVRRCRFCGAAGRGSSCPSCGARLAAS
jgi:hypothetical protein